MPPANGTRTDLSAYATGKYNVSVSTGVFSPGQPISPLVNEPVRPFDFNVGVNTIITPRQPELLSFATLRAYSNVELIRMAIETRKDQLERLEWQIKPIERQAKTDAREKVVEKFFRRPDGINPFATWLRLLVEDLLALDAPALEKRRDRSGKLIGLDVVQGDTIKLLVDDTGRRPQGKDTAFQQVIKGHVWADLTNDDLMYIPRNPRPGKLYGYSPVEQIVVTINTIMRRQAVQLAYFTEGNVPQGILNAPTGWSPDAVKNYQDYWDARSQNNAANKSKALWVPADVKYQAFKEPPLKDDFDEWLARIVAFCFSLPPTPFIKQMNRSTGQTDQDRALEEGLEPIKLWVKRFLDDIIQLEMGHDDLEFAWVDTPNIDPGVQSQIDDRNLRNGSVCIDEVRANRGMDPLPDGMGEQPLLYVSTGALTLEQVLKASEDAMAPPEPMAPLHVVDPGVQTSSSGTPVAPTPAAGGNVQTRPGNAFKPNAEKKPAEKMAKVAQPAALDRPLAKRSVAAVRKGVSACLGDCGDEVAAQVSSELKKLGKVDPPSTEDIVEGVMAILDLTALDGISAVVQEPLADVFDDASTEAVTAVNVGSTTSLSTDGIGTVYQAAVDYASKRAGDLVSVDGDMNIVAATRQAIRDAVTQGLADNIGSAKIADNIQAATAFSKERAQAIALNEIRMANASGKLQGWQSIAAMGKRLEKRWQTSNVYKCCDACGANEAEGWIPLDQPFSSGAMNEADSHPNCQCVTTARVVRPSISPP